METIPSKEIVKLSFRRYVRVGDDEKIKEGAISQLCDGPLCPIMGIDTIGDTPSSFSRDRKFYNPL